MTNTTNIQTADGWTHLNNLESLNDVYVQGNLTVLGTTNIAALGDRAVITPITTVGNGTIPAAAIIGGYIVRTGPVAAFSDTLDTAVAIIAAQSGISIGETFTVEFKNGTAFTQTLVTASGLTLPATVVIPAFSVGRYLFTVATATTITIAHLSTDPITTGTAMTAPAATTISTVGAGVITAAAFNGSLVLRSGSQNGTPFTDTTDTAVAIIAACANLNNKIGTSMFVEYSNSTNAVATITGGVGVTVSGVSVIPANTIGQFLLTYTAAATMTMVGTGVTQSVSTAVTMAGASSGQTVLQPAAVASGTLTLPAVTDTLAAGVAGATTATFNTVNTTTLANVPGLSITVTSSGTYHIQGQLQGVSNNGAGLKAAIATTGSLTSANITGLSYNGTTIAFNTNVTAAGSDFAAVLHTYTNVYFDGTIVTNTGGTLTVQAAQHTSSASTSTILAGSYLQATRIS